MSEKFRLSLFTLALAVFPLATGCGKDHAQAARGKALTTNAESTAAGDTTVADASVETTMTQSGPPYKTTYDAKAVYGLKDLPGRGSYLKLDFTSLTPDQLNRVIHRLRTEDCTCGCEGDLIDQCLVNDPSCSTAVQLANQIIREEKMKS